MTREEREAAIRHINSALDVDEWAQKAAETALSIDWNAICEVLSKMLAEAKSAGCNKSYQNGLEAARVTVEMYIKTATRCG